MGENKKERIDVPMKHIQTFRGEMPLSKYKRISPHEHLFIDLIHEAVEPTTPEAKELYYSPVRMDILGPLRRNPYIVRDNLILSDKDDAVSELKYLQRHNVGLFVDLSCVGIERNVDRLRYVSDNSQVDITLGTGFYVHDTLSEEVCAMSVEEMADFMINEIENGIDGTDIRAGVIGEIGVSEVIYPVERKALLASAIAHKKTGLPVYVHTYPWSRAGLEAADLLRDNGVAPHNICICHVDVTFDYEYLLEMLKAGYYIEFDNFGKEFYFPPQDGAFAGGPFATDVERVRMLKQLMADGYGKQLIAATDICLKASLHKYGGWGYDHIFENIIPMMQQEGFSQEEIDLIIDENPMRFLLQETL